MIPHTKEELAAWCESVEKRLAVLEERASRAKRPELPEIAEYMQTIGLTEADAEDFLTHQQAVGWKYGKGQIPVKDWKAACRTWKTNGTRYGTLRPKPVSPVTPAVREREPELTPEQKAQAKAEWEKIKAERPKVAEMVNVLLSPGEGRRGERFFKPVEDEE